MKRLSVICVPIIYAVITIPCLGQTTSTGPAETTGACSPAVTGSNNQFTITCQGISEKLRVQLVSLINMLAKSQSNADAIMTKLDGCVAGVNQIVEKEAPRHLYSEQREKILRAIAPYKNQRIGTYFNPNKRENREFTNELTEILTAAGWNVYNRGLLMGGPEPLGVVISVPESDSLSTAAQALVQALSKAGISPVDFIYEPAADPDGKYLFGKLKRGEIQIQVGDKP